MSSIQERKMRKKINRANNIPLMQIALISISMPKVKHDRKAVP